MTAGRGLGAGRWEWSRAGWRGELGPARRGAHAGFSSKAHFLETEQDSHAGVFGKVNIYQKDPLLSHYL